MRLCCSYGDSPHSHALTYHALTNSHSRILTLSHSPSRACTHSRTHTLAHTLSLSHTLTLIPSTLTGPRSLAGVGVVAVELPPISAGAGVHLVVPWIGHPAAHVVLPAQLLVLLQTGVILWISQLLVLLQTGVILGICGFPLARRP